MKCCICGKEIRGYGNNPYPVVKDEGKVCCDHCNQTVVIPARIAEIFNRSHETHVVKSGVR